MKKFVTYSSNRICQWPVLFLLLCLNLSGSKAPNDDSTKLFPINDPRNPNCPCHKYQKLADEEFARLNKKMLLQKDHQDEPDDLRPDKKLPEMNDEHEGKVLSNENGSHKKHNQVFLKRKRRKKLKKHPLLQHIFNVRGWDIWKRITDPSACYHWK